MTDHKVLGAGEMAASCGVTVRTVARWERWTYNAWEALLLAIATWPFDWMLDRLHIAHPGPLVNVVTAVATILTMDMYDQVRGA